MTDDFKAIKEKCNIVECIEAITGTKSKSVGDGLYRITPCVFSGCNSQSCFTIHEKTQSFSTYACGKGKDRLLIL
jgi:DNA primase